MEQLRIGLHQMRVQEGDAALNIERLELAVAAAARQEQPPDLLCFPELCVSGYDWEEAARWAPREKSILSRLAKKHAIPILAGVLHPEGDRLYDVACLWDEDGAELAEYRKIHLWGEEAQHLAAGEALCLLDFRGWRLALMICADLGFAELATEAALQGAQVLLYLNAWSGGHHYSQTMLLAARTRAMENQLYTVALNRAAGNVRYCGNSLVCGPDGGDLLHLAHDGEAYAEVLLEKGRIGAVRKILPWLGMRRPQVYAAIRARREGTV